MDKELLVSSGHALVSAMDGAGMGVRFAMWVHNTDTDIWKLWIVPSVKLTEKREFYRRISEIVSKNRENLNGIDASDTEYMQENHPAIEGLKSFIRIEGLGSASFSGNTFNGFYLPNGVILRSAL
jgi:hypothetical protein